MASLQIHSTFKRSNNLENLIEKHFQKLQRLGQQIRAARVSLRKERKAKLSDVVTINLAVEGEKDIVVKVEDSLFEKSVKNAFKIVERQLKR